MTVARILLVEDDEANRQMLKEALTKWGHAVTDVGSGEKAVALAKTHSFDIVLSDIRMFEVDGLAVLRTFRQNQPQTAVILMTAFGSVDSAVQAIRYGAFDYVPKPFKIEEIKFVIRRALEQREEGKGTAPKTDSSCTSILVGHSKAMTEIYKVIAQVAEGKTTVLLLGESGTGKELVARSIHSNGLRAKRPFVALNCAAIMETLLESELFGYAKGAFTGAVDEKPGLFEMAEGGTLYLDEIGDAPPSIQAKLLRTLEDQEIRRVGGTEAHRIDVRIITSTNKDLPALCREDRFREDLYYRLNAVTIVMPPLRQHKEDIPALIDHFVAKYNALAHKNVQGVSSEALKTLTEYSWPGNVRELEKVIERGVILNNKARIMPEDLPDLRVHDASQESLDEIERRHILQIVQQTNGNIRRAAEVLGIDRKTLYRKAAKYNIRIVRE